MSDSIKLSQAALGRVGQGSAVSRCFSQTTNGSFLCFSQTKVSGLCFLQTNMSALCLPRKGSHPLFFLQTKHSGLCSVKQSFRLFVSHKQRLWVYVCSEHRFPFSFSQAKVTALCFLQTKVSGRCPPKQTFRVSVSAKQKLS